MNFLSLLGVEMAFSLGRKEGKRRNMDDLNQFENQKNVPRNRKRLGDSNYWTVDSQFWT
jgi:hypothetical protein